MTNRTQANTPRISPEGWRRFLRRTLAAALLAVLCLGAAAAETAAGETVRAGDILCFGAPDEASGFDGRWLVLDAGHTNTGAEGIFAVSLGLIGGDAGEPLIFRDIGDVSVSFGDRGEAFAAAHPGVTDYQGSDLQRWTEGFLDARFTEAERQALIPTDKSDAGAVIPGIRVPLPGAANGTVDFDPAEGVLRGDRLFPLSAEEAYSAAYGFTDNRARVALFKGEPNGYWLRSPHIPTFPLDVGFVFGFGALMDYPVNARSMFTVASYARPACNIDAARIAALEPLGREDGVTLWRVSFRGGEANRRVYALSLPEVGSVPDIQTAIAAAVAGGAVLLAAAVFLLLRFILRRIRRRA